MSTERHPDQQPPLDVGETDVIDFDFSSSFASAGGFSTASRDISVVGGVDATPGNVLVGAMQISGTSVLCPVRGQVRNVTYLIRCTAVTNETVPRTLVSACLLPVVRLGQN